MNIFEYDEDGTLISSTVEEINNIYLHIDITGGDEGDPIGIINDGEDSATITCTFRTGESSDSDVYELDMTRRISICNSANVVKDIIKIAFESGVSSFEYVFDGTPGIYHIDETSLTEKFDGATIVIVGDTTIKVFRDFTS